MGLPRARGGRRGPTVKNYEIYLITAPGYWYVGSTRIGAARRLAVHRRGAGGAKYLYAKMDELGVGAFGQTVVESSEGDQIEAEQRWYDFYIGHDSRQTLNGKRPGGWDGHDAWSGRERSAETRAKISASLTGRERSAEHCAKISAGKTGKVHGPPSEETKAKMSAAHKGRKRSPETCAKIGAAHKGKVITPEQRAKMSAAKKGVPKSPEHCAAISAGMIGRKRGPYKKRSQHEGLEAEIPVPA